MVHLLFFNVSSHPRCRQISHIHPRALSLTHTHTITSHIFIHRHSLTHTVHTHTFTHRYTLFHGGMQPLSLQTEGTYQLTPTHTHTRIHLHWHNTGFAVKLHMRMWTSLCVAQDVGQVVISTVYVILGLLLSFLHSAQIPLWSGNYRKLNHETKHIKARHVYRHMCIYYLLWNI